MIEAEIHVAGIVQGVGFRPFIFRLAAQTGIGGSVANTPSGVLIRAAGAATDIDRFIAAIRDNPPPLAEIHNLTVTRRHQVSAQSGKFTITASIAGGTKIGPITPDTDVCENCLAELFDPHNRRCHYPFINCTDCGPRFSLIEQAPYDRPQTAMKDFAMCRRCRDEYEQPADRRFHAQATCCPDCGPSVWLTDNRGQPVDAADPIRRTADLLRAGHILAIKGSGGFHLTVDAENQQAVAELRRRKGRPDKPLAVMAASLQHAAVFAELDAMAATRLSSHRKPIILLPQRQPFRLAAAVAPANRYVGVMLPYTPIHHLLFHHHDFTALVMTSGNLSGDPIATGNREALTRLGNVADHFLLHNRPIVSHTDDSVLRCDRENQVLYRRARAYTPTAVRLRTSAGRTLALGALIKNTICLTNDREAFVSQHIGDLDNYDTQLHQEKVIRHFQHLLRIEPDLLVRDLHPDYPSSRYALSQKKYPVTAVQHHHAHAVSCMAEHGLAGPVIALTLDGNGYGPDQTVWGGEILIADLDCYNRIACLEPVPLPGGDAAAREPWRMAVSHLRQAFGPDFTALDLPVLRCFSEQTPALLAMMDNGINAPLTSSCGRLFDAVSALLDLRYITSYEGQAAAELENLTQDQTAVGPDYQFSIDLNAGGPWKLGVAGIIGGIVNDLQALVPPHLISLKFHEGLARLFTEGCRLARNDCGLDRVVLSGGVFQNLTLLQKMRHALEQQGFTVFSHLQLPPNDGGLAVGQAVAGRAIYQRNK